MSTITSTTPVSTAGRRGTLRAVGACAAVSTATSDNSLFVYSDPTWL